MKKNIFKILVMLAFSLLINKISLSAPICSGKKDEINLSNEDKNQITNNNENSPEFRSASEQLEWFECKNNVLYVSCIN